MLSANQANIRTFEVVPSLPDELSPLTTIAYNLWWSWHPEAVELFSWIDRQLWEDSHHNPVKLLGVCPQERLEELARDEGYCNRLHRVHERLQSHISRTPWHVRQKLESSDFTIAYFCAEFGMTECLQIYSGGLGCLAGDHLKSAAELGLPLIGIGLLYRNGYFQQYLNADGWQQEYYPDLDFANLPVSPVTDAQGRQVRVSVSMPGREVMIAVWKVYVGCITLYLLDTNQPENDAADRAITSHLYGGDMDMRIKQEIVLGIGGVRALEAMNIKPDVCHMNEGHSAFLALERIRKIIDTHNISFDEARQFAAASHVFTTHTPVPAGIDRFPPEMIQRYFKDFHPALRLDMEGLLALGRENVMAKNEFFSMAVLALRTSDWANGVSKLHGEVSRSMWHNIWPGIPENEVPIDHVTNGVHARSWLSPEFNNLLDRYLGARWQDDPADQTMWEDVTEIPDEELWRVHEMGRQRLIIWTRKKVRQQMENSGANMSQVREAIDVLDPNALTIGFARRFATYKRGTLFLRDRNRLAKLLASSDRPIQFLIAGKSHPADGGGKDLIKDIVHASREIPNGHRIVFIENYDINVAKYLVQGCDVWLNNPRRGMEASGTSGMKAALNGVLNCSVLDGWWDEAFENDLGWGIGRGESYVNVDSQDEIESKALYELLENQIIPSFYDRDDHNVPRQWVKRMKRCISQLAPAFNTNRMVKDYMQKLYLPALRRGRMLGGESLENAVALASQKSMLRQHWPKIRIDKVEADTAKPLGIGQQLSITATVTLGEVSPDVVKIQAYTGEVDNDGRIIDGTSTTLTHASSNGDGVHVFTGQVSPATSGRYGFAVRVVPGGAMFDDIVEPGLIRWDAIAAPKPSAVPAGSTK